MGDILGVLGARLSVPDGLLETEPKDTVDEALNHAANRLHFRYYLIE